jgi:GH35 family endo-1,4-beta-xylanase
MSAVEANHLPENKSESKFSGSFEGHAGKLQQDSSVDTLQEHRAIFKQISDNYSNNVLGQTKEGEGQLIMAPLPGFLPPSSAPDQVKTAHVLRVPAPDSSPFIRLFPQPLTDGEGQDVHLKMRGDHEGTAKIELMQPKAPFAQTLSEEIPITGKEQDITLHGIAPASKDGLMFKLKTAGVGGLNVEELSVTPSQGLTEAAHYSIENGEVIESKNNDVLGKNSLGKSVELRNGKPFIIGFEIQSLDLQDHSQGQQNIQKFLIDHASGATNTPYWSQYQDKAQPFIDKANWAEAQGIEVKEHPALWDQMIPGKDAQGNPLEINAEKIKQHVQDIARLPGQFTEVNETADVNSAPDNAVTRWIKNEGPARATEEAIAWAKQADPTKTILYNDYQNGAQEMRMLDQMQKDGKLPDAIGIQLHMDQGNWPLSRVEETVNNLAKYGKPIYITEISVLSGANGETMSQVNHLQLAQMASHFNSMKDDQRLGADVQVMATLAQSADSLAMRSFRGDDFVVAKEMLKEAQAISIPALRDSVTSEIKSAGIWADTAEGEKSQADYTENLYKVLHSNPHVQGITWWDLSDKNSWKQAPRGWFKEDGSPKLVVDRMSKLFDQWRAELPKQ